MKPWFKHGADWHESRKLVKLIMQTGYEGYGIYSVLLELILSSDGMLESSWNELNFLVRCETGLLKRVVTKFDLFDVKTLDEGRICLSVDWLLKDIDKSRKTSLARSASGRKGMRNRYGAQKASEHVNTVGVPNNVNLTNVSQSVTNDITIATTDECRLDKNSTIKSNDVNSTINRSRKENMREGNFFEENQKTAVAKELKNLLPEMKEDCEWHNNVVAMLHQKGVGVEADAIGSLIDEFFQFQAARGRETERKTLASAKSWFFNWVMFQIEKVKKNGTNNNSINPATNCGGDAAPVVATGQGGYRKTKAEQVRESKEKLVRDTAEMLRHGEFGDIGQGEWT